ncbi:MAG: hypothetical protein H6719_35050 [Sandaracinaceae bacterium]|nr:hypothetical protein [Sandaracinaceae bacterium]
MDRSPNAPTTLLAILERRASGEAARVARAREARDVVRALLGDDRDADHGPDVEAALATAGAWLAARLSDPSKTGGEGGVEHASAHAREALRELGPRAAEAVLGQLSPARTAAQLVDTVQLLEEMTEGERASGIPPAFVPRLATLLAVRREAPILRALGCLVARLADHDGDPDAARARLRALLEAALDGDREDRREAAFHVLGALGSPADDLADRLLDELGRSPSAGVALGALSPDVAYPRVARALQSSDADVVFGALRAVEVAAGRDHEGAAAALADECIRRLHDPRPRVSDQALLSLLVLGPPLRALTIWTTAVVEREAAWLFSLPFRAGHLSDELLEALFGLVIDEQTPRPVRDKIRGLFFGFSRLPEPPARARRYWERLKQ